MTIEQEIKRWAKLLPIIQAFVDGKTIQFDHSLNGWEDVNERAVLSFEYSHERYRVKPEPRTFWLRGERVFTDKASADAYAPCTVHPITEVREVLS